MSVIEALNHFPWLLGFFLLFVGLSVGSFLNVVIYRLPVMMQRRWKTDCCELLNVENGDTGSDAFNLMVPNSRCPGCGHAIRAWENIPVLSYLVLRGRCSSCNASISPRYPVVETVSGVLADQSSLLRVLRSEPESSLPPDFVRTLTTPPEKRPYSAEIPEVATVVS